jgi:hypothetical protein
MRSLFLLFLLLATITTSAAGCGGSSAPTSAEAAAVPASGKRPSAAPSTVPARPNNPIAQVAFEFVDAMRRGDAEAARRLLTPLALSKVTEDYVVAPPGSATARFEIGAVKMLATDDALVESDWIDIDVDGKPQRESSLVALRLVDGQWRVYGMVFDMGDDQPLMPVDFENPDTMAPKQPAGPEKVVDGKAVPAVTAGGSAVARNRFEEASQR